VTVTISSSFRELLARGWTQVALECGLYLLISNTLPYLRSDLGAEVLSGFLVSYHLQVLSCIIATKCGVIAKLSIIRRPDDDSLILSTIQSEYRIPHLAIGQARSPSF